MIGELAVLLVVVIAAGGAGLWLGIVVLAPRLQRRLDRAAATEPDAATNEPEEATNEPEGATKEPDGPAD
jgi:hypothetical protein